MKHSEADPESPRRDGQLVDDHRGNEERQEERRPHHCIVTWGDGGLPRFDCVIESLSIKYTMFDTNGSPLRATATVKLKEALIVDKVAEDKKPNQGSGKK